MNNECIDCVFSEWHEWEPCTCEGLQERRRSVSTKNNACGAPCSGTLVETINCKPKCVASPQDCALSEWSEWNQCDKECDGGQQYRDRHVLQRAHNEGTPCEGDLKETRFCNMDACYSVASCSFGMWSEWSQCSATCDTGEKKRSREIETPAEHGGKPCNGPLEEVAKCGSANCLDSMDCQWGDWIEWTTCTKTCGGGSQSRTRMIVSAPKGGGKLCDAKVSSEVGSCNDYPCNGQQRIDCVFEEWSAWDACSCTVNGITHRVRHVSVYAKNGGKACGGATREIKACNVGAEEEAPTPTTTYSPVTIPEPVGPPVDCAIGAWTDWDHCSEQCGYGMQTRSRKVEQYPKHGGEACAGPLEEMQGCENAPCEEAPSPDHNVVDFRFGNWDEWGACSVSCAGGERTRSRRIAQNANMYGKAAEHGSTLDVEPCNTQGCDCTDCQWTVWSEWGACTCTGLKEHHREISTHANDCGKGCEGARVESARCQPDCEGPVLDCAFDSWSEWSACTVSCGGGQRQREREVNAEASLGGRTCDGSLKEVDACNSQSCFESSPCELSEWTQWTKCSVSCGTGGQQTRVREVTDEASHNGKGCTAVLKELRGCSGEKCGGAIIDCEWGAWTDYGSCSVSCGGGHKTRSRTITQAPRHDGKLCEARSKSEVVGCNTFPCSGAECTDGQWGEWQFWGPCAASCGRSFRARHRVMAVTASSCGHPAEGPSSEYEKCALQECNDFAVDCSMSEWSEWGVCSCTCNGVKERVRTIATYSRNGGRACNDPLKEVVGCNLEACKAGTPVDCELSAWAEWNACSKSCNSGVWYRERKIITYPENFGKACEGPMRYVGECNTQSCTHSVDCKWGEWSEWGVCSKECEGGDRHRYRHVDQMAHQNGAPCAKKDSAFIEACNEQECSGTTRYCTFGPWDLWTACSVSCGEGKKTRTRALRISSMKPEDDQDLLSVGVLDDMSNPSYQPTMEKLSGMFTAGALVSVMVYATFLQVQRGFSRRTSVVSASADIGMRPSDTELPLLSSE